MFGNNDRSNPVLRQSDEALLKSRVQQRLEAERTERERVLLNEERVRTAAAERQARANEEAGLRMAEQSAIDYLSANRAANDELLAAIRGLVAPLARVLAAAGVRLRIVERVEEMVAFHHGQLTPSDRAKSMERIRSQAGWPAPRKIGYNGDGGTPAECLAGVVGVSIYRGDVTPSGVDLGNGGVSINVRNGV